MFQTSNYHLFIWDQYLDICRFLLASKRGGLTQVPLSLRGLLVENMIPVHLCSLDFSRSAEPESLGRSAVRFYFWHLWFLLISEF